MILPSLVLSQYTRVTGDYNDKQTHTHTQRKRERERERERERNRQTDNILWQIRFLSHPLGKLGVTYVLYLGLVEKRVVDFLFAIIELFR